ncbi:MAG TPA: phosphatidate cytidylyltransferase [Bryobacteraceae bacterium]|nr:phosphatidate cytidylyltransferase [Bryobacteraceae bacterium]
MKRLLTAAALIPVIVYVVLFAGDWLFFGVLAAAALLTYREYDGLAAASGFGAPGPLGYGFGLLLLVWAGPAWLAAVAAAAVALAMAMRASDLSNSLPRAALLSLGVLYAFGCWKCALPLREANRHWLMFALLVNWVGDGGAYYAGRAFGKHKMAPRVSPQKSWEGAAASMISSMAIAGFYLAHFTGLDIPRALVFAAAANAAGQIGDLAESAIKRGAGVKDSGTLLPGHGGFLDRVDSTLFALPAVYALGLCFKLM